jgi:glutathione S-transferase
MADFTIVIGNKKYSSWSLRGWLMLKHTGVPFEEIAIQLNQPNTHSEILKYSPSGKVPALMHQGRWIWESLALGEYLAELFPDRELWPADPQTRAAARSISAEMHAGFTDLRQNLPMDLDESDPHRAVTEATRADIERITSIWNECRVKYGADGDFLFGKFGIADAMYAPVVNRFTIYRVGLDEVSEHYRQAMWELPAMREWREAARAEPWKLAI